MNESSLLGTQTHRYGCPKLPPSTARHRILVVASGPPAAALTGAAAALQDEGNLNNTPMERKGIGSNKRSRE